MDLTSTSSVIKTLPREADISRDWQIVEITKCGCAVTRVLLTRHSDIIGHHALTGARPCSSSFVPSESLHDLSSISMGTFQYSLFTNVADSIREHGVADHGEYAVLNEAIMHLENKRTIINLSCYNVWSISSFDTCTLSDRRKCVIPELQALQ